MYLNQLLALYEPLGPLIIASEFDITLTKVIAF